MDVLTGQSCSIRAEFDSPTGALIPDANSCAYSLYDYAGALLAGPTPVVTGANDTDVSIAIVAAYNTIAPDKIFERRSLVVTWTSSGQSYRVALLYRVIPPIGLGVSPADVRTVIGIDADELPDAECDLLAAYISLAEDIGRPALDAALASGTKLELVVNRAIIGQAVLDLAASLPLRAVATRKVGEMSFSRFTNVNWSHVIREAREMRSRGLAAITGTAQTSSPLIVLSDPRDQITGCHAKS
jgi:hypothetical protein